MAIEKNLLKKYKINELNIKIYFGSHYFTKIWSGFGDVRFQKNKKIVKQFIEGNTIKFKNKT